jgi:hypothetical protein
MDREKDNSQDQQDSGSQGSQETQTGNTNAGTNLPDRDPQILEKGHQPRDLEKREK